MKSCNMMTCLISTLLMISSVIEAMEKNVTGAEGGSITLPDPVIKEGFLIFGGKNIAMVIEGKIHTFEEIYKDRVLWNNNTGLFTITGLQRNDSGIYNVDSKEGRGFTTSYKVTVYDYTGHCHSLNRGNHQRETPPSAESISIQPLGGPTNNSTAVHKNTHLTVSLAALVGAVLIVTAVIKESTV
ncbi:uncharacterized protein ABDE67_007493 [Symphorus nematophorus]